MTLVQKLAVAYASLFFGVVAIGYIPASNNADGNLFGLFSLQWYDDVLHAFSGLWALAAAFISHRQSVFYFKLFGSVYLLDGVLGLITGSGCLDAGIFINGLHSFNDIEFPARFFANLPHIVIGGFAVYVGFGLSKRVHDHFATA